MVTISPLNDVTRADFEKLFTAYYAELGCEDDCAHLVNEYVIPDLLAGLLKIDVLTGENGSLSGFVIYQIDDIDNDWCVREGWGDIREIYVEPLSRRKGLGRFLLYTAEMKLKEVGAKTSLCIAGKECETFFLSCGYSKTQTYYDEFSGYLYEKNDIENCKCGG